MLEKVKTRLSILPSDTSKDALITQLIDDATSDVKVYLNVDTIPDEVESTTRDLVIIYYNRLGIEGQSSHSEGGVNVSIDGIPLIIGKKLNRYRKLSR